MRTLIAYSLAIPLLLSGALTMANVIPIPTGCSLSGNQYPTNYLSCTNGAVVQTAGYFAMCQQADDELLCESNSPPSYSSYLYSCGDGTGVWMPTGETSYICKNMY